MMVNKKWVKILKAARKRIEGSKNIFVSSAIRECSLGINLVGYFKKESLLEEISSRLGCCSEIYQWMVVNHPAAYAQITDDNQWIEYHLAWIDNMIEEFSGVATSDLEDDNFYNCWRSTIG